MMATNRSFRGLLVSDAAYQLWLCQFEIRWGKLPQDIKTNPVLRNDEPLDFAASESVTSCFGRLGKTNLPLLLSMTPEDVPKNLFRYSHRPGERFDVSRRIRLEYSIRITGYVYSVKANIPLPKPKVQISEIRHEMYDEEKEDARTKKMMCSWNMFVVPYRTQTRPADVVNVSPRLVSYYEITIETRHWENPPPVFRDDCVCIGLTMRTSPWIHSLPGWDRLSFGYHGDNGGLYHGSRRKIGLVGTFGLGDTVGMGIDYINHHIFVTKNGRFVTAFRELSVDLLANTHLFPVVGLYTKHAVRVNYMGLAEPFCFDLAAYCSRDQQ
ncbi:MAG: hypothetical protein SGBAC_001757 [Bacillariaceae sp.]